MDFASTILVITLGANSVLGMFVWRARKRNMSAQLFLVMVALIMAWTLANYAVAVSITGAETLFWIRSLYVFAIGYVYVFYLFARTFAQTPLPRIGPYSVFISLIAAGSVVATMGTRLVFASAARGSAGIDMLTFGPLYIPISIFVLVTICSGIAALISTARHAGRTATRDQAILITIGWVAFLGLVIVFATILPYFIPSLIKDSKLAPLFSIIMVACSAYAIVRHRFLDITPLIRRGIAYSALLGSVLGLYLFTLSILNYVFRPDSDALDFSAGLLTVVLGTWGAPHIAAYFRKKTDWFFFKDRYEYSAALEELCHLLNTAVHIPELTAGSLRMLDRLLKPERIEFHYLKANKYYDLKGECTNSLATDIPDEQGLIMPIHGEGGLLGEIILWAKRSGDPYTKEDCTLLRTFASQARVAFEKAELYDALLHHSDELETKVAERTRAIEILHAGQREFMDDISHALQTPLTVLMSSMESILKHLPSEQKTQAKLMTRSMNELSRLIRNLLALARAEVTPNADEFVRFNLSESIECIVEYVEVICASKAITLSAVIEPSVYMRGDQMQLEEAVTNTLSNAVRYTAGCATRKIYIQLSHTMGAIRISIKDTGVGISAERMPHIFKRFYRAQNAKGSGIGLAITKGIVERHGGCIETQSTLGGGTTMVLHFNTNTAAG